MAVTPSLTYLAETDAIGLPEVNAQGAYGTDVISSYNVLGQRLTDNKALASGIIIVKQSDGLVKKIVRK